MMLRGAPPAAVFVAGALDTLRGCCGCSALTHCESAVVGETGAVIIPLIVAIRFTSKYRAAKHHCVHRFVLHLNNRSISTFGSCNGSILTGARVIYASARDGQLPSIIATNFMVLIILFIIAAAAADCLTVTSQCGAPASASCTQKRKRR